MYKSQPVANRLLAKKQDERNLELHLQRLRQIKSTQSKTNKMQNSHSELLQTCSKLRNSDLKKLAMQKIVGNEVERENRSLLERIAVVTRPNYRSMNTSPIPVKLKSLNQVARKQDIVKITQENQEIYKRIQAQKSNYNSKDWESHSKAMEYYFLQLCEYPPYGVRAESSRDFYKSNLFRSSSQSSIRKFRTTARHSDTPDHSLQERTDDLQTLDLKFIKISKEEGKKLLAQYNNRYDALVKDLYIENDKLKHKFLEANNKSPANSSESKLQEKSTEKAQERNVQKLPLLEEKKKTQEEQDNSKNAEEEYQREGFENSPENKENKPIDLIASSRRMSHEKSESKPNDQGDDKKNKENAEDDGNSMSSRFLEQKILLDRVLERPSASNSTKAAEQKRTKRGSMMDEPRAKAISADKRHSIAVFHTSSGLHQNIKQDEPKVESTANKSDIKTENKSQEGSKDFKKAEASQKTIQKRHSVADTSFNSRLVLNTNHSKDLSNSAGKKRFSAIEPSSSTFHQKPKNDTNKDTKKGRINPSPRINESQEEESEAEKEKGHTSRNESPKDTEKVGKNEAKEDGSNSEVNLTNKQDSLNASNV